MCSKVNKEVCRVQVQAKVLFAAWFILLLVKQILLAKWHHMVFWTGTNGDQMSKILAAALQLARGGFD